MLEVLFGVLFGPKKVLFCMKSGSELKWYYKAFGNTGLVAVGRI
jgi:hypothetical protein